MVRMRDGLKGLPDAINAVRELAVVQTLPYRRANRLHRHPVS